MTTTPSEYEPSPSKIGENVVPALVVFHNPPEAVVPLLEADDYYRVLVHLTVPMYFVVLIVGAWFAVSQDLGWFGLLGHALVIGAIGGIAVNAGHELGHKKAPADRLAARLALAVPFYGHFTMEHNAGHHAQVATPEDSASARMGESIYRFALREIPGGVVRAWSLERRRLERRGSGAWSGRNHILQSYAVSVVLYGALLWTFGLAVLPFFVPPLRRMRDGSSSARRRFDGAILIVGLVITLLAALYPAWFAARLEPIEALRAC